MITPHILGANAHCACLAALWLSPVQWIKGFWTQLQLACGPPPGPPPGCTMATQGPLLAAPAVGPPVLLAAPLHAGCWPRPLPIFKLQSAPERAAAGSDRRVCRANTWTRPFFEGSMHWPN